MGKTWRDVGVVVFGLLTGLGAIAFLGLVGYAILLSQGLCDYDCPSDTAAGAWLAITAALLAVPLLWMSAVVVLLFTGSYPSRKVCAGLTAASALYSVAAVLLYLRLDSSNQLVSDAAYLRVLVLAGIGLLVTWLGSTAVAVRVSVVSDSSK